MGTDEVGALSAGASRTGSLTLNAPPPPGTYYYGACADAVAEETNTANNCSAAATPRRYYRSADATITTSDAQAGTDAVDGLAASGMSPELIALTAPATSGTYYYGACVDAVSKESNTENNCSAATQLTVPEPPPRMGYDLARRRRRCSVAHRRRILKAGLGVRRSGIPTPSELSTVNSSDRCAMGRDATGDKAHATSACVEQIEPEQTPGRCSTFR